MFWNISFLLKTNPIEIISFNNKIYKVDLYNKTTHDIVSLNKHVVWSQDISDSCETAQTIRPKMTSRLMTSYIMSVIGNVARFHASVKSILFLYNNLDSPLIE